MHLFWLQSNFNPPSSLPLKSCKRTSVIRSMGFSPPSPSSHFFSLIHVHRPLLTQLLRCIIVFRCQLSQVIKTIQFRVGFSEAECLRCQAFTSRHFTDFSASSLICPSPCRQTISTTSTTRYTFLTMRPSLLEATRSMTILTFIMKYATNSSFKNLTNTPAFSPATSPG